MVSASWLPGTDVFLIKLAYQVECLLALRAVQRDLAATVDKLAPVGDRHVLKGLLGKRVRGCGCGNDAGCLALLQLLGRTLDVGVGLRLWQASGLEKVLPVEEQIGEAITRHGDLLAIGAGQLKGAFEERVSTQSVNDLLRGLGID